MNYSKSLLNWAVATVRPLAFAVPMLVLLWYAPVISAQTTITAGCMQDIAGFPLNCTANDIQIAAANAIIQAPKTCSFSDLPGPDPDKKPNREGLGCFFDVDCILNGGTDTNFVCNGTPDGFLKDANGDPTIPADICAFAGDYITFSAVFDVRVTAKNRYDVGLYFSTDGDTNEDGAVSGQCSISTMPYEPDPPWLDLDGTTDDPAGVEQDLCGDIDKPWHNPLEPTVKLLDVACVAGANGKLSLPNCTSWRQTGANELCLGPLDAFPGSPSKCNCDDTFTVDIDVPAAELLVTKTANPTTVNEPSGTVTFTVEITNTGIDPNNNVTLNTLTDDIYGNLDADDVGDHTWLTSTCLKDSAGPVIITPGGTYTCSFTGEVSGNGGDSETDKVTAEGVDDNGNTIKGEATATVTIVDVLPKISVTKTADPTSVLEGSGTLVTFTVTVDNDSTADPLTITALTDDIHGDLDGQGDCATGATLAVGGSYSCSFTAIVDGQAFTSETDTVTAVGVDDEFVDDATTPTNKVSASDTATVTISDDVAKIELIKTADPTSFNEPSEDVTYTFTVNNLSDVDTVTINSLTDTVYDDLTLVAGTSCALPQDLAPTTGTYTCSITVEVTGDAGEVHTNVATAKGVDDDGVTVMDDDDATVNIEDVPPAAMLAKTATMVVATFEVVVTNKSSAEELTLTALSDDMFPDIMTVDLVTILASTCAVPQTIAVGASYSCTFDAKINAADLVGGSHTNTVTATVKDNEGTEVKPFDSATVSFD